MERRESTEPAAHREKHGYAKTEALALDEGKKIRYMQPVRRVRSC